MYLLVSDTILAALFWMHCQVCNGDNKFNVMRFVMEIINLRMLWIQLNDMVNTHSNI